MSVPPRVLSILTNTSIQPVAQIQTLHDSLFHFLTHNTPAKSTVSTKYTSNLPTSSTSAAHT